MAELPLTTFLARDGDMWADVNDVVAHFNRLCWVPRHLPAMLAAHRIDAQALIELTDDDLRDVFFIVSAQQRTALLEYIQQLLIDSLTSEPQMRASSPSVMPVLPSSAREQHKSLEEYKSNGDLETEMLDAENKLRKYGLDSDTLREKGADKFQDVEIALLDLQKSWIEERHASRSTR